MNLKPLGDRVVVKVLESEENRQWHRASRQGQGEAPGRRSNGRRPGKVLENGTRLEMSKGGGQGHLSRYAGTK